MIWQVEVGLVHCCEELPHLLVLVNGPLAERILVNISVREGILFIKHTVVPGEEGHNEGFLAHGCRRNVDAHRVASLEDRMQLHDGVLVGTDLRNRDPHLVASGRIEDPAELGLQHAEPPADLVEAIGHISGDDQDVVLELQTINVVHPLLVDPDVEVHIAHGEYPGGALGPPLVHVEPRLPSSGRLREHADGLHQAGVQALPCKVKRTVHLHGRGKDGIGLLALAASQEGDAETGVRLGQVGLRLDGLLGIGDRSVPHLELREGG
mmetsp:Transcript_44976/g.134394  ORF Transcript_44976/g.134394 Transcript_44976/m.134394 type:complete len:266 (-) Transcript_44976:2640-3437(-)